MTKAHMKRLLSPKVLHPRPQRPVHQPGQLASPAAAARAHHGSPAPAIHAPARSTLASVASVSVSSIAAPNEAPLLALADPDHDRDRDLEHSFFAAGLSEDTLRAISERQREQVEQQLPAGRAQKVIYGFAACACLLLAAGYVGARLVGNGGGGLSATVNPPAAPVVAAPAMPAPPSPPIAPAAAAPAVAVAALAPAPALVGAELPPAGEATGGDETGGEGEVAVAPRTVGVAGLRAGSVADDPTTEPAAEATKATKPARQAAAVAADEPESDEIRALRERAAARKAAAIEGTQASVEERSVAATALVSDDPREACGEHLRNGRFRHIKESCGQAFEAEPDAQLATEVARAALDEKRNHEAAAWARKAIAVDANFADAFVYLGAAENQLGHSHAAREAYGRYLQLEPNGEQADSVRAIIDSL